MTVLTAGGSGSVGLGYAQTRNFTNLGTLSAQTAGQSLTLPFGAVWQNQGIMSVSAGTFQANAPVNNENYINVSGGVFYLGAGWSNSGMINLTGGTLSLAGSFNTADLGSINQSTGIINIAGSLDNTANSFVVSAATPLEITNGTISNGAINSADGTDLPVSGNSTLNGVTLNIGVNVSSGGTLALTGPWTNNGAIDIPANSRLNLSGNSNPAGFAATVYNAGSISQSSGNVSPGALSGTGSLTIGNAAGGSAAAMMVTSLTQSRLVINATGSLAIGGGAGNGVNTLSIFTGGRLDLTNTALAINYTPGFDPVSSIRGYLKSGYGNDTWTGPGIDSSAAALNPGRYAIGYADGNVDQGTAAAANQILVEYTLAGDANLDGTVNFSDLLAVAQNFNHSIDVNGNPIDWADGDFNYDGKVNFADLLLVAQNFNQTLSAGQIEQLPGSFSAAWNLALAEVQSSESNNVPEPAAVLAIGAAGLLSRRRRRQRHMPFPADSML
jgi:hypothetical protein